MARKPIELTIVNDSGAELVCADCEGGKMTSEQLQLVVEQLEKAYGDQIQVQVIDLARSPAPRWRKVIDEGKGAALPLLALNGVPRLWGKFDYRMAAEVIEVQREMAVG